MSPDLGNRFGYHKPDATKIDEHSDTRRKYLALAEFVQATTPPSREQSLALTALEEAMFWTNAAIARMAYDGTRLIPNG